jgi:hypothetical protein
MYLRLVTSAQIRSHEIDFMPFLADPELQELIPASKFCENYVESTGKEAGMSERLHSDRKGMTQISLVSRSRSNNGLVSSP